MRRVELKDDDALALHKLSAYLQEIWADQRMTIWPYHDRAFEFWTRIAKATKPPRPPRTPTKPIEQPKKKGTK